MWKYIEDFKRKGFGLFVHFGLYSMVGKGEWHYHIEKPDKEEYFALAKKFNPSKNWARDLVNIAKDAGCKYITITTRHHDGFSLYDTKGLSDFQAPSYLDGRDLIKEFVEECEKKGVLPMFYHTLLDWTHKDYEDNFENYLDYLISSIEVLCTSYGKIGGFWFDGSWSKPNADWQEDRLYGVIRKYQPEAMIINNTGLSELGKVGHFQIDSVTFERGAPRFVDNSDKPRAGEMCQVLCDHWGLATNDINYKSMSQIISDLIDCRKYGCNFLLNVGPDGKGRIPLMDRAMLGEIGKFIKANDGFIYNVTPCDVKMNGADVLYDGKYYYAVIKGVGMSADPNVQLLDEKAWSVNLQTEGTIRNAVWLDNKEPATVIDKKIKVLPFAYGNSLFARVLRFELVR